MSRWMRGATLALLVGVSGCALPDPMDLVDYADACRTTESCAPGFACQEGHCVIAPGAVCRPGFELKRCERTGGQCAGAARACVDGVAEDVCDKASYGDWFQAEELACDGVDNDCDGRTDVMVKDVKLAGQVRWVESPAGLGAFNLSFKTTYNTGTWTSTWSISYHRVADDGGQVLGSATLEGPFVTTSTSAPMTSPSAALVGVPTADGALLLWRVTTAAQPRTFVARVVHGAQKVEVAVPPRELSFPNGRETLPRLALSRDGSRAVAVWSGWDGKVWGQALGLDGTTLTDPVQLNAGAETAGSAFGSPEVLAVDGGVLVAWMANPAGELPGGVRMARFGPALELLGDVRTVPAPSNADALELASGAGAALADVVLGWLVQQGDSTAVDVVSPYGDGAVRRVLGPLSPGFRVLNLTQGASGELVIAYPQGGPSIRNMMVRFIRPGGAVRDVSLALGVTEATQVSFRSASDGEPTVRAAAETGYGLPVLARVCRP